MNGTNGPALNLNVASRPLRNRRLFLMAVRGLGGLAVVLAALSAFIVLKDGRALSRLRKDVAETQRVQADAQKEQRRLKANIDREEKLSQSRIDLVNGIIGRKMFSWTGLFTDLETALPGPSYIMGLTPSFTTDGAVALDMRVSSRNLEDFTAFKTALNERGFKNIKVGNEQRSADGRLLSEISATYERPL